MVPGKNADLEPRHLGSAKCNKSHIQSDQHSVGFMAGVRWWRSLSRTTSVLSLSLCDLGQVNKPLRVLVFWKIGTVTQPPPSFQGNWFSQRFFKASQQR